jgi:hypothetical protein
VVIYKHGYDLGSAAPPLLMAACNDASSLFSRVWNDPHYDNLVLPLPQQVVAPYIFILSFRAAVLLRGERRLPACNDGENSG